MRAAVDIESWVSQNCRFAGEQMLLPFEGKQALPRKKFLCRLLRGDGAVVSQGERLARTRAEAESRYFFGAAGMDRLRLWKMKEAGYACACDSVEAPRPPVGDADSSAPMAAIPPKNPTISPTGSH